MKRHAFGVAAVLIAGALGLGRAAAADVQAEPVAPAASAPASTPAPAAPTSAPAPEASASAAPAAAAPAPAAAASTPPAPPPPHGKGEQVQIADAYIELRTGPGRGYPIFHVAARDEWIEIELRHTDWFRVRTEGGKVGWVLRQQLETTLTASGVKKGFRDVLIDDYLSRRVQLGAAWGHFKSEPMLKLWTSVRMSETLSAEATVGTAKPEDRVSWTSVPGSRVSHTAQAISSGDIGQAIVLRNQPTLVAVRPPNSAAMSSAALIAPAAAAIRYQRLLASLESDEGAEHRSRQAARGRRLRRAAVAAGPRAGVDPASPPDDDRAVRAAGGNGARPDRPGPPDADAAEQRDRRAGRPSAGVQRH